MKFRTFGKFLLEKRNNIEDALKELSDKKKKEEEIKKKDSSYNN